MPVLVDPQAERIFRSLESLLRHGPQRLLTEDERGRLLAEWTDVDERERNLDDRLFIGLVGGTGVGKSTFVNALAGREISSSGDRRPTTDRVVVYRHESLDLPEDFPAADLAEPQMRHREDGLERVVVLDFPDFDSVEARHRDILFRYLPHLDVVFVLADDVKYADRCLFDLLESLPHDARNVYYVLNKIDTLEQRYVGRGDRVAREMLEDWRQKLREHAGIDVDADRLLGISALAAFESRGGRSSAEPAAAFAEAKESAQVAGHFGVVLDLVSFYREEKWRREAKSLNLLGRKHAFVLAVRGALLSPAKESLVSRLRESLDSWARELRQSLDRLSDEALTEPQRVGLRAQSLGGSAVGWPLPISLFFSAFARRTRRRVARAAGVEDRFDRDGLALCIRKHYRATLDVFANLESAIAAELEGSHLAFEFAASTREVSTRPSDDWAEEVAQQLAGALEEVARARPAVSRLSVHALPSLIVVVSLAARIIAGYFDAAESEGLLARVGEGASRALTPVALLSVLAATVVTYGLIAYGQWSKRELELDEAIGRLLAEVRESVHGRVRAGLERFQEFVESVEAEWRGARDLFADLAASSGNAEAPD